MSFETKLIEEVRKHKILYQKSFGGYKNVSQKYRIWKEIAATLSVPEDQCQTRWKSMRDRYSKEMKQINMPSGNASAILVQWEYYNSLNFLREHIRPRKRLGNSIVQSSTSSELHSFAEDTSSSPITLGGRHRTSSKIETIDEFTNNNLNAHSRDDDVSTFTDATHVKKRRRVDRNIINETILSTLDTFKKYLDEASSAQAASANQDEAFMRAVSTIISTFNVKNQIRARAEILSYLSSIQLQELKDIKEENIVED